MKKHNIFLIKDDVIKLRLDRSQRTVLIEKSPFLINLQYRVVARNGFEVISVKRKGRMVSRYNFISKGRKLMIRPINKLEWQNANKDNDLDWLGNIEKLDIWHEEVFAKRSDYYIIIDCDKKPRHEDEREYPFLPIGTWIYYGNLNIVVDKKGDKIYSLNHD